jgi:hypothetical protein
VGARAPTHQLTARVDRVVFQVGHELDDDVAASGLPRLRNVFVQIARPCAREDGGERHEQSEAARAALHCVPRVVWAVPDCGYDGWEAGETLPVLERVSNDSVIGGVLLETFPICFGDARLLFANNMKRRILHISNRICACTNQKAFTKLSIRFLHRAKFHEVQYIGGGRVVKMASSAQDRYCAHGTAGEPACAAGCVIEWRWLLGLPRLAPSRRPGNLMRPSLLERVWR